jgi:hypothetical protein
MRARNAASDCQPEAVAASGTTAGRLDAIERFEHGFELVLNDAGPLVPDYDADPITADRRLDDGTGPKSFDALLAAPDLEDIFAIPYPAGDPAAPGIDEDPGRARPEAFFDKMYGNCRTGRLAADLVAVDWLPAKGGGKLEVTPVNGVADKLRAISAELDRLPASFDDYLRPVAGSYNCRTIAGTRRTSTHGHGIAVDLALKQADYWRWTKPDAAGRYAWRNRIPIEIVRIFERHSFIWGGRWYHFDTMHFEYRPELLAK